MPTCIHGSTDTWSYGRSGKNAPGISDAYRASKLLESKELFADFAHTLSDLDRPEFGESGSVVSYLMPSYERSQRANPAGHPGGGDRPSRCTPGLVRRVVGRSGHPLDPPQPGWFRLPKGRGGRRLFPESPRPGIVDARPRGVLYCPCLGAVRGGALARREVDARPGWTVIYRGGHSLTQLSLSGGRIVVRRSGKLALGREHYSVGV
jgi:hypothetical protein